MRYRQRMLLMALTLCGLLPMAALQGCTGIELKAQDGSIVHGRTAEFGIELNLSTVVIPRGYQFTATTPNGPGLRYRAKYGAVGAIAFDTVAMLDGLNEKGLAVGAFYFPGFAGYAKTTAENLPKALSPIDFSNWLLTQFATIEEVKKALNNVVIVPTVFQQWGTTSPPFHYIVYDKSGSSIVIEPIDGKLVVYDNPNGVITNSPSYDWHLTNLRNYINLRAVNVAPLQIKGLTLSALSQGSGLHGLPGDYTSPSRFVRATFFALTATPSSNAQETVWQAFHILNNFDIPVGSVRSKEGDVVHDEFTLMTCVRDPGALTYYIKTINDQNIAALDLRNFNLDAKELKKYPVWRNKQEVKEIKP